MTANLSSTSVEQSLSSFADGLRALANLIEQHPILDDGYEFYRHLVCVRSRDKLTDVVRELGGHWRKDENPGDYFGMTRDICAGVSIYVYAPRDAVCERVVVGQRTVQKPAPDAPMVSVTEDIVEWRCPDSLLAPAPDRDDDKPLTEAQMFEASGVPYGLAVKADELARKRRLPHQLREDATGRWPR